MSFFIFFIQNGRERGKKKKSSGEYNVLLCTGLCGEFSIVIRWLELENIGRPISSSGKISNESLQKEISGGRIGRYLHGYTSSR